MAKKNKTPEDLFAMAEKIKEEARKLEQDRFVKLGKLVDKYFKIGFSKFDSDKFTGEVQEIYG